MTLDPNSVFDEPASVTKPSPMKTFFSCVWRVMRGYFVVVGIFSTISPLLILFIIANSSGGIGGTKQAIPDLSAESPSALRLKLDRPLLERTPTAAEELLRRLFDEESGIYLPEIRRHLERAAADVRISRLDIEIIDLEASVAEISEFRRILEEFREGGKPIHVTLSDPGSWEYYLSSVADTITVTPTSAVNITGPVFTLTYFGEAVRKLGVDLEVVKAGRFKSAFEPFVQNQPSAESLQQYESMEDSLREHMVEVIAKGRSREADQVRNWLAQSIFTAKDAIDNGVVDAVGYSSEAAGVAANETQGEAIDVAAYGTLKGHGQPTREVVENKGGIALIEAVGEIHLNDGSGDPEIITPASLKDQLEWAGSEPKVKAVVLRVSSPGGSATASDLIWQDVRDLADLKPVVVSMGAYAASGGYYIAAPARKIYAEPTTITGSIGVIGMLPNFGPFEDKWGVSFHTVTQSERKQLLDPGQRSSAFDKAIMQSTIDQVYEEFLAKVAAGRRMTVDEVAKLAEGRVYTGLEAVTNGLVDELGGLREAIQEAKALAGFDVDKLYPLMRHEPDALNLSSCLANPFSCLGGSTLKGVESGVVKQFGSQFFAGHGAMPHPSRLEKALAIWGRALSRGEALTLWAPYLALRIY